MLQDYKDYVEQKEIKQIVNSVLSRFPLLGVTISTLKFIPDKNCQTAMTDGNNVYYNMDFLNTLSFEEKVFVLAHEIFHVALQHIYRCKDKNMSNWNIATDAVINARLVAEGLPMIEGGVNMPEAIDKSSEEIYNALEDNSITPPSNSNSNDGDSNDNENNNAGHDDHSNWQDIVNEINNTSHENNQEGDVNDNQSELENSNSPEGNSQQPTKMTEEEINEFEKHFTEKNRQLKEEKASEIIGKLKGQRGGSGSGSSNRSVGSVGTARAVVKWKNILRREFDKEDYSWTYRRSDEDNFYQARLETVDQYDHPRTEVMLDTSGSVDEKLLRNFLKQLKPLLRESEMFVGCFDDEFYGFVEVKREKDIERFRLNGGGGTDFDNALKHFSEGDEINRVVFTDGYDHVSKTKYNESLKNLYWIVFENTNFDPCCGKVIYVDKKQLRYLQGKSIEDIDKEFGE